MNDNEVAHFCAFYRRSRYDMVQARHEEGWGPPWTFAPCDPSAAARSALMLRRAGVREFRHARRARLRLRPGEFVDAVVITELPLRLQIVLRLADGSTVHSLPYLRDESLQALEEATKECRAVGTVGQEVNCST